MTTVSADGRVEFRFYRPKAYRVGIAGDFNEWNATALGMQPTGNGWWVASAPLPPGEYRFRYVADGTWFTDYASYGVEPTQGGWNAVLLVPAARRRRRASRAKSQQHV